MIQKIPCFCDTTFSVEIPEEIDLDARTEYIDQIINGTFLNFSCPGCGKKHKPEFAVHISWPSRKVMFDVYPELERGEFYRIKKESPQKGPLKKETIIGYPELADRVMVYRDSLEPVVVEAIKYYLHLKAEENYPEEDISIWYNGRSGGTLEFHIHGIREGEVASTKVPDSLYDKTMTDYRNHPRGEIFTALKVRSYLSVRNTMRPAGLK